ncbi:MAG: tetratricopeptide repeat protein [Candidatus Aureabacteria bacterium]|nr:tetratricopeptide repeat protein [Candidatus Auribacterota bacterium]
MHRPEFNPITPSPPPALPAQEEQTTPVAVRSEAPSESVDEIIRRAQSLVGGGREEEALRILGNLIEGNPKYAEAYMERATVYVRQKQYSRAVDDYQKIIAYSRDKQEARYGLGGVYEKWAEELSSRGQRAEASKKFRDAIAEYKEVLWRRPGYPFACYSLGCVYSRLGQREDAIFYFKKTVENSQSDSALTRKARYNLRLMGDY